MIAREAHCYVGWHAAADIGFLVQLARWHADPAIWREQVQLAMPDGTFLLYRGWSRKRDDGAPGGLLDLVDRSENLKELHFVGPARPTGGAELGEGPLKERIPTLVSLSISFHGTSSPWMLSAGEAASSTHIEQPGRFELTCEVDGESFSVASVGHRHFSCGPSNLSEVYDHCWANGTFENGDAFALIAVRPITPEGTIGAVATRAAVWEQGILREEPFLKIPLLGELAPKVAGTMFEIALGTGSNPHVIEATVFRDIPHSTSSRGDWLDGIVTTDSTLRFVTHESGALLKCGRLKGFGHIERSRIVSDCFNRGGQ